MELGGGATRSGSAHAIYTTIWNMHIMMRHGVPGALLVLCRDLAHLF